MSQGNVQPPGYTEAIRQMLAVLASASSGDLSQRIPVADGPPETPEAQVLRRCARGWSVGPATARSTAIGLAPAVTGGHASQCLSISGGIRHRAGAATAARTG